LQLVDGFAQLLTVGFSGSIGFLGTDVFHKTDGDHVFDSFAIGSRCVIAKDPRHSVCASYLANTSFLIPGHQTLLGGLRAPGGRWSQLSM
jgi:hypothetical protein